MPSLRGTTTGLTLAAALLTGPVLADETMIQLATQSGCFICHSIDSKPGDEKPLAPTYRAIAERYAGKKDAADYLTDRVIKGTAFSDQNWAGRISMRFMPPNVNLNADDARKLVDAVLKLDTTKAVDDRFRTHERMMGLAATSGCFACHELNTVHDSRLVPLAPSFEAIAVRYKDKPQATDFLARLIVEGTRSTGKQWADTNMEFMPPNVALAPAQARELAAWVLTVR